MIENVELPQFKPRGLIKIELFDELTGKKVEEVNGENFISKGVKETLFKMSTASLFTKRKVTGGRDIAGDIYDPFRSIVLTNANHPEAPDTELLLKGSLIGYAYSDAVYSGSDVQRGGYNAAESFTNLEQVRMVFDFPTHAVIGTFRSIYFMREPIINLTWWSHPGYSPRVIQNSIVSIKKYKGKIYSLEGNTTSSNSFCVYDANFNLLESFTLPNSKFDFEIVNDFIYFVETIGSRAVQRAPISNPVNLTAILTSFPSTSPQVSFGGILHDAEKNQFIVGGSSGSGSGSSWIFTYDTNFNLISSDLISKSSTFGNNDFKLTKLSTGEIVTNFQVLVAPGELAASNLASTVRGEIDDCIIDSSGYLIPKVGISSRSLLDAPITKNDKQTMKITYDFVLPPM